VKLIVFVITFYFLSGIFSSCNHSNGSNAIPAQTDKESMINSHRNFVSAENERIDNYVKRRNWEVIKTGTGLRYLIYERKDSLLPTPKINDIVVVTYKVTLLNGKVCYEKTESPEHFRVAKDNVESGLHEGIQFMRPGEKAYFIMPSHLAHGLIGDLDQIPMNATIVYDLHLHQIQ
jgi:FKBP-type peptidyl-prolyl cis-trans isomerase